MTEGQPAHVQSHKRRCVALAGDTGISSDGGNAVVIGNCVSENAIVRSGLLSGIESTEGLASLPNKLSPDDVRLWETAYFIDVEFPSDELATVFKVADALGDTNADTWAEKLADRVLKTDQAPADRDAILRSLLLLPPHLLDRVFTKCLWNHDLSVAGALKQIPPPLHPPLLSFAVANGAATVTDDLAAAVLPLLSVLNVPAPGLTCLEFRSSNPGRMCATAAAMLARAAAGHTSLATLSLTGGPLPPQWLRTFSAGLPSQKLPNLVSLSITAEAHPGGCAEVATCAGHLRALTRLDVSFNLPREPTPERMSLSSFTRLAATPAALPLLQFLSFTDGSMHARYEDGEFEGWEPLRGTEHGSCVQLFLSVVSAPAMTRLTLSTRSQPPFPPILRQLARFPCLQEVSLSAETEPIPRRPFAFKRPSSSERETAAPALPALTALWCHSRCPISPMIMAAAIAEQSSKTLTSMIFNPDHGAERFDHDSVGWSRQSRDVAEDEFQHLQGVLRRCSALQVLDICFPGAEEPEDEEDEEEEEFHGSCVCLGRVLSRLTQLTHLGLRPSIYEHLNIDGSELGGLLRKLSTLQSVALCTGDGSLSIRHVSSVLEACGQLPTLTRVDLRFKGVEEAEVACLIPKLPSLKVLHLREAPWGSRGWATASRAQEALAERFSNVDITFF